MCDCQCCFGPFPCDSDGCFTEKGEPGSESLGASVQGEYNLQQQTHTHSCKSEAGQDGSKSHV